MASKRRKPRGGWSSSPNQWKTPQSTRGGPKGCVPALFVIAGGITGAITAAHFLWQWVA